MDLKTENMLNLNNEKMNLIEKYPKFSELTEVLFLKIAEFADADFDGVAENKVFREFVCALRAIIEYSFESNASKAYLRSFFKSLNNFSFLNFLAKDMKTHLAEVKLIIEKLVNFFVYQDSTSDAEYRLNEILTYIDGLM